MRPKSKLQILIEEGEWVKRTYHTIGIFYQDNILDELSKVQGEFPNRIFRQKPLINGQLDLD